MAVSAASEQSSTTHLVSDDHAPAPYSLTVRGSGIGLYRWDPVVADLSWDNTSAQLFDASPGERPMDAWARRTHVDDHERVMVTFSEHSTAEAVYRLVMDDGSVRHILSRATRVERDLDGQPTAVHGVMLDITEVHQSAARLKTTLDSISDGFIALDHEFRFLYVNRRGEQLLETDFASLVGRSIWEAYPHALGTKFETVYRQVMRDRVATVFEEHYPEPLDISAEVRVEPSDEGIVLYFHDISNRRAQEAEREQLLRSERAARRTAELARLELLHLSAHDHLTGLMNRSEFEVLAARMLQETAVPVTALFMDLDRFKLVNDSLGHAAGDALLVEVAMRLRSILRSGDVAARLGGDEFVVLLPGSTAREAQAVAERVLHAIREPFEVGHYTVSTTVSVGLASARHPATVATLLRNADVALYRAKDAGRNSLAWFDHGAHQALLDRVSLEADLRATLNADGLDLRYQPIFSLPDMDVIGVEALARWSHPTRGNIAPDVFIPLAEDAGLIKQLGGAVTRASINHAAQWSHRPNFTVWFNVSGRQLDAPGFARDLLRLAEGAGLEPGGVGIEVRESVVADELVAGRELAALSAAGIPIAIDDFGTGFSSLARLFAMPLDVLKIDRSFVERIHTPSGRAAVDVIVHLARALGLRTVAEGVESQRQLDLVAAAGADRATGYYLAPPAAASDSLSALAAPGPSSARSTQRAARPV